MAISGFSKVFYIVRCPSSSFVFGWEGEPPSTVDYRKKGTLILSSLLEDLVRRISEPFAWGSGPCACMGGLTGWGVSSQPKALYRLL